MEYKSLKCNAKLVAQKKGLCKNGKVQKIVDSECIRLMRPYTPMLTGVLAKSPTLNTEIGSGKIVQATPYARYLYYGKAMVSPTGSAWAKKGESKHLSGKDLNYNMKNPKAGAKWFERMKADKKSEILKTASKAVNEKS
ncbi:MAG: minor capsid protein [Clostridia bacterium]